MHFRNIPRQQKMTIQLTLKVPGEEFKSFLLLRKLLWSQRYLLSYIRVKNMGLDADSFVVAKIWQRKKRLLRIECSCESPEGEQSLWSPHSWVTCHEWNDWIVPLQLQDYYFIRHVVWAHAVEMCSELLQDQETRNLITKFTQILWCVGNFSL